MANTCCRGRGRRIRGATTYAPEPATVASGSDISYHDDHGTEPDATASDILGDATTTSTISAGESVVSTLEITGDRDWFAITVTAGQQVVISLGGHGATPVGDTYLRLRDSAGNLIDEDDDSGEGLNSQLCPPLRRAAHIT